MEDYAPSIFLGSWALVVLYLCFRFHIFNKLNLKSMSFKLRGGPHLFHVVWDNFPLATRKMHLSFENLTIINTLGL
jgi:hypothetical protein